MDRRVFDISIADEGDAWSLYIPIRTGSLELRLPKGDDSDLSRFVDTAMKTPTRRFGENPVDRNGRGADPARRVQEQEGVGRW
jgi:hypothetical protein